VAEAAAGGKLTRNEAAELVKAVRAKRPVPAAKRDPVAFQIGECVVTVKWKKAGPTGVVQALKQALKAAQAQERAEGQAA
jgi:hypothetical protein